MRTFEQRAKPAVQGWVLVHSIVVIFAFLPIWFGKCLAFGDLSGYFVGIARSWQSISRFSDLLWNPNIASGYPMLANPQFNPVYWPDWLFLIPATPMQIITLNVCLHLWISGAGMLVWSKAREIDKLPALLIAMLFMFQGVAVSLHSMLDNFQVLVWVPWIAWAFLRCEKPAYFVLLVFFLWCAIGAGDPQMVLIFAVAALPWILLEGRRSRLALMASVIGLLAQPWLLPFLEALRSSDRAAGIQTLTERPWGLDLALLSTSVFPSTLQHPGDGGSWLLEAVRTNWIQSLFIGIVPLMTFWKGVHGPTRRWILLAASQGLMVLLSIKGVSWIDSMRDGIPVLSMIRFPSRFVIMIPVILLFLFAESFRRRRNRIEEISPRMAAWTGIAILTVASVCVLGNSIFGDWSGLNTRFHSWVYWLSADFALAAIQVALVVAFVRWRSTWVLILAMTIDVAATVKSAILVSPVVSTDKILGPQEFDMMGLPEGRWINLVTTWNDELWESRPKREGTSRHRLEVNESLRIYQKDDPGNWATFNIEGYRDVWTSAFVLRPPRTTVMVSNIYNESLHVAENILWHAGIQYSLVQLNRTLEINSPYQVNPGEPIAWLRTPREWFLASKHTAIPPVFVFGRVDTTQEWSRGLAIDPRIDPIAFTTSEDCQPVAEGSRSGEPPWEKISSTHWRIDVRGWKGVVVLVQDRYPGWEVLVDGIVRRPKVVNMIQMGACLDGSERIVEFRYRPFWLLLVPGQLLLAGLLLCVGVHRLRTKRAPVFAPGE